MKKFLFLILLAVSLPLAQTACSSSPSSRVVQVQTLKAVGQSAETAVSLSAQLYAAGKITAAQANQVRDLYDLKFQPAYRVAVSAVQMNLDSIASPDLLTLAQQLTTLVASFQ